MLYAQVELTRGRQPRASSRERSEPLLTRHLLLRGQLGIWSRGCLCVLVVELLPCSRTYMLRLSLGSNHLGEMEPVHDSPSGHVISRNWSDTGQFCDYTCQGEGKWAVVSKALLSG